MSYQDDRDRDAPPPLPPDRRGYDEPDREQNTSQKPPEKKSGMSKGCMWALAGCGCVSVLAAIAVIGGGAVLFNMFKDATSMDPAVVKATTQEIGEMNLPEDLKPKMRVAISWPIGFKMVIYQSDDNQSMLTLLEFNKNLMGNEQQRKQFEQQFRNGNQQGGGPKNLEIIKSEQKEVKIRGETSKVTFAEAKDPDTGTEVEQISGGFNGKSGPAQFILVLPKEKYNEEDVIKLLEEIK